LNEKKQMLSVYLEQTELTPGLKMNLGIIQAVFYYTYPTFAEFQVKIEKALAPMIGSGDESAAAEAPTAAGPTLSEAELDQRGWERYRAKDYEGALADWTQTLELRTTALGANALKTTSALHQVVYALFGLRRFVEAEPLCARAVEARLTIFEPDNEWVLDPRLWWSEALRGLGRTDDAITQARIVAEARTSALGLADDKTIAAFQQIAYAAAGWVPGEERPGIQAFAEARQSLAERFGPDDLATLLAAAWETVALSELGRWKECAELCDTTADAMLRVLPWDHNQVALVRVRQANALMNAGKSAAARELAIKYADLAPAGYWANQMQQIISQTQSSAASAQVPTP
jgi:hypothetical protein